MDKEMNVNDTENQNTVDTQEKNENAAGTERTFTQEEVNKIVENRLKRERQKISDLMGNDDPKEAALRERERKIIKRELRANAAETFQKEGLPEDMLELLNYENEEMCNQSIELVRKVYTANVQAAVNERLKGSMPIKKAPEYGVDIMLRNAFGL